MTFPIKVIGSILLLSISLSTYSQDMKVKAKFISFKNARLSIGVGIDGSLSSFIINTSKPGDLKVLFKDPRKTDDKDYPFLAGGLALDLYSDNSVFGLLFGANIVFLKQGFKKGDSAVDYFDMTRLEFPISLKLRPGEFNAAQHFWLLIGGIYSMPLDCKREHFRTAYAYPGYSDYIDNNKEQLSSCFLVSTSLGFEGYLSAKTRFAFFGTASYPLIGNAINSQYSDFKSGGKSVFSSSDNAVIKDLRLSFGLKILFGFWKTKGE